MPWKSASTRRSKRKEWWAASQSARSSYRSKWKAALKAKTQKYIMGYLASHPCVDCGEDDPIVLEFDHRDRSTKSRNVSELIQWGSSRKKLDAEIAKCDVVCANCHRRRTHKQIHSLPTKSDWGNKRTNGAIVDVTQGALFL